MTIEDSVNITSGTAINRRMYFTHDLVQDGVANNAFADAGVTVSYRTRLSRGDDPLNTGPAKPDGLGIFSNGKGMFGVHQVVGDVAGQLIS